MGAIYPATSAFAYCEVCDHVTVHDTSSEPATCQACSIRLVASVKKQ